MLPHLQLVSRKAWPQIGARDDEPPHQFRVGPRKSETHISAVAVADDIDGAQSEKSDDFGRIFGHVLVRERTGVVGAVAVTSLINADDGV